MATAHTPSVRRERLRFVIESAGTRYAAVAGGLILGLPIGAFLTGSVTLMFYTHVVLGAFWFGLDYFFRYVLAPAIQKAGPDTASALLPHLTPRIMVVGESLTLGTIGSGIGLAYRLDYWTSPSVYLWAALGVALVMLAIAFGPLHHLQTGMVLELASAESDGQRVGDLNRTALRWLLGMTGLMLVIIGLMTGLRGLLPPIGP